MCLARFNQTRMIFFLERDFRVASKNAKLGVIYVTVTVTPSGIFWKKRHKKRRSNPFLKKRHWCPGAFRPAKQVALFYRAWKMRHFLDHSKKYYQMMLFMPVFVPLNFIAPLESKRSSAARRNPKRYTWHLFSHELWSWNASHSW